MGYLNRTYRTVDGERIAGSWRHIFIKNGGTYFLADLKVYADGMIDCWGLVDLATFRRKVASGWVATTLEQGGQAGAYHLARWTFEDPHMSVTPSQLIAEVADEIERLAGRPTSEDRCIAALDRYIDDPTEGHLAALRDAYLAVPGHHRMFLLGDQDAKDRPLRILLTPVGQALDWDGRAPGPGKVVQPSDHEAAWEYFRRRRAEERTRRELPPPWEDDAVTTSQSVIHFDARDADNSYLANDYPAPITVDGHTFPTVEHAYWVLATADPETRDRIARAGTAYEACTIGQAAQQRADWHRVRLAVMTRLVREKFRQHPALAAKLRATGDGRLINSAQFSRYWGTLQGGRNWLGRILELVRAELEDVRP